MYICLGLLLSQTRRLVHYARLTKHDENPNISNLPFSPIPPAAEILSLKRTSHPEENRTGAECSETSSISDMSRDVS
jgi:hypothetical protein